MVRLCFLRKNKTLGAIFRQASVLALLEANAATVAALQKHSAEPMQHDSFLSEGINSAADDADIMDDDMTEAGHDRTQLTGKKHKFSLAFKEKVVAVLDSRGMTEKRAAKLSQDVFLALLAGFNAADIHFSP